jgi:hypothetical protein
LAEDALPEGDWAAVDRAVTRRDLGPPAANTRAAPGSLAVTGQHLLFGQARHVLPARVFLLDVLEDIGVGLLLPAG